MDTPTTQPNYDTSNTRHLGLAPVVHGLAQRACDESRQASVQWMACELFGSRIRPYRHLCDRSIVAMDVLEHLAAGGFTRRGGEPCKIKDAAGANQVYLIECPTTPIPAHEPHDLPAAHRLVLDDFRKPNEVGGSKSHDRITVWALLAPYYCHRARVNEAYKRISERILKDLEDRNLIHRCNGWYCAT